MNSDLKQEAAEQLEDNIIACEYQLARLKKQKARVARFLRFLKSQLVNKGE